ncbi:hypothetical protein SUDANB132_00842 [Streptomyces sp. enrichment culture]
MLAGHRQEDIARLVRQHGSLRVSALTERLDVSHMTPGASWTSRTLTVVTNSVQVARILHTGRRRTRTVVLTCGVRTPSDALVGPVAVAAPRTLRVDVLFMGVYGRDARTGFSTPNPDEAETDRAMCRSARRTVSLRPPALPLPTEGAPT